MKIELWKKNTLSFLLAIIGAILITSLIANYMIDTKFDRYLLETHEKKIEKVRDLVEELYLEEGSFSGVGKELQRYAVLEELYIEIQNPNREVIYTSGYGHLMPKRMMGQMMHRNQTNQVDKYNEESYSIKKNGIELGTLNIGYYGQWNLTERDMVFKDTLNNAFGISITAALLFGLIISFVLSRHLSIPLVKLTRISNEMRNGNLEVRSDINSSTKEIEELSESINYLAKTLQHQEMLRKRLTADMAHEIRTPLTTLQTHVEAMIDGVWEPSQDKLSSCHEEILRLTKLVDSLQDLAKLEQLNHVLNKSKFNLSLELEKILDTFQAQYANKGLETIKGIKQDVIVDMDKDKLRQIMFNLLSNAYKYSEYGGLVTVKLKQEDDRVEISVIDNGVGIEEEDLEHIFERFYRGDVSRNRATGGSGIGLTIVKTLVEVHGGKIIVESQINKGTCFHILIPVNKD